VDGKQEVIAAIEAGDAEQLKTLLARDRTLASARDASGVSAIMHSLYRQRKDMVELLRAANLEFDVFEATSVGRGDLVEELITRSPRLANARSGDGFTPLHFAAFLGHETVARVLLEHHADAGAVADNPMKVMPLHSAAAGRNLAIVLVQFCIRILLTNVIGSPKTLRAKPLLSSGIPSDEVFHEKSEPVQSLKSLRPLLSKPNLITTEHFS